jgi:hypothetical protein
MDNVIVLERINTSQVRAAVASADLSMQLLACKVERLHDELRDQLRELLSELSEVQILLLDCKDLLTGRIAIPAAPVANRAVGG